MRSLLKLIASIIKIAVAAVVVLVAVMVAVAWNAGPVAQGPAGVAGQPPKARVAVGQVGRLCGLTNGVWLALGGDANWNAMLDAQNRAGDGGAGAGADLYRLAEAGKIKFYEIGQRVRVVGAGLARLRVEVADGPDRGDAGTVQVEFVCPE